MSQTDQDQAVWEKARPQPFYSSARADVDGDKTHFTFALLCLLPKKYWPSISPVPSVKNEILTIKYDEFTSTYQLAIDESMRGKYVKKKDVHHPVELTISVNSVRSLDAPVGTRMVDGVKTSISTHWCSDQEISKK